MEIYRDQLTELPDRNAFYLALSEALSEPGNADRPLSIGILDVDLFGSLNEKIGSPEADGVLRLIAERLSSTFPPQATAYRFGGDAFALLWRDMEKEEAFLQLESFRRNGVEKEVSVSTAGSQLFHITLSAGLAAFPDDAADAQTVVNKACEALYRAKVGGRDKTCLPREEKMAPKTSHYTQGQLMGLRRLAEREGISDAVLLREALNDLLRKYNA